MNLDQYPVAGVYDELIGNDCKPRLAARALFDYLARLSPGQLNERREAVDAAIMTERDPSSARPGPLVLLL